MTRREKYDTIGQLIEKEETVKKPSQFIAKPGQGEPAQQRRQIGNAFCSKAFPIMPGEFISPEQMKIQQSKKRQSHFFDKLKGGHER